MTELRGGADGGEVLQHGAAALPAGGGEQAMMVARSGEARTGN
jgi:hypothetical protein